MSAAPEQPPATPPAPRRRQASTANTATTTTAAVPGHGPLYDELVAWRLATARSLGRPAFTVFNNDVLTRISDARPATRDELAAISGVGPTKLADWGADILHIVATHSDH